MQGGAKLVLVEGVSQSAEATTPTKVAPTIDAEAEMWAMVKDSNNPNDIKEFVAMFPEGKLAKVAAFKLRKLQTGSVQNPSLDSIKASPDQMIQDEGAPVPPSGNQRIITWAKDNSQMVLIPAGSFEMGDHFDESPPRLGATPVHTVTLDAFYMDVHEVTVGQFREFVNQGGIAMVVIGMR